MLCHIPIIADQGARVNFLGAFRTTIPVRLHRSAEGAEPLMPCSVYGDGPDIVVRQG